MDLKIEKDILYIYNICIRVNDERNLENLAKSNVETTKIVIIS